jgi:hypothetical protein
VVSSVEQLLHNHQCNPSHTQPLLFAVEDNAFEPHVDKEPCICRRNIVNVEV